MIEFPKLPDIPKLLNIPERILTIAGGIFIGQLIFQGLRHNLQKGFITGLICVLIYIPLACMFEKKE
jgi:hypothetical protein